MAKVLLKATLGQEISKQTYKSETPEPNSDNKNHSDKIHLSFIAADIHCVDEVLEKLSERTEIYGQGSKADLTCIDSLNLHGNSIQSIKGIEKFSNVHELILSSNNIEAINPISFASLCHLHHLNLACNHLRFLTGIKSLKTLKTLDLSYNQLQSIEGLGEEKSLPNLKVLKLQENQICNVSELRHLAAVPALTDLHIHGNPLFEQNKPNITTMLHQLAPMLIRVNSKTYKVAQSDAPELKSVNGERAQNEIDNKYKQIQDAKIHVQFDKGHTKRRINVMEMCLASLMQLKSADPNIVSGNPDRLEDKENSRGMVGTMSGENYDIDKPKPRWNISTKTTSNPWILRPRRIRRENETSDRSAKSKNIKNTNSTSDSRYTSTTTMISKVSMAQNPINLAPHSTKSFNDKPDINGDKHPQFSLTKAIHRLQYADSKLHKLNDFHLNMRNKLIAICYLLQVQNSETSGIEAVKTKEITCSITEIISMIHAKCKIIMKNNTTLKGDLESAELLNKDMLTKLEQIVGEEENRATAYQNLNEELKTVKSSLTLQNEKVMNLSTQLTDAKSTITNMKTFQDELIVKAESIGKQKLKTMEHLHNIAHQLKQSEDQRQKLEFSHQNISQELQDLNNTSKMKQVALENERKALHQTFETSKRELNETLNKALNDNEESLKREKELVRIFDIEKIKCKEWESVARRSEIKLLNFERKAKKSIEEEKNVANQLTDYEQMLREKVQEKEKLETQLAHAFKTLSISKDRSREVTKNLIKEKMDLQKSLENLKLSSAAIRAEVEKKFIVQETEYKSMVGALVEEKRSLASKLNELKSQLRKSQSRVKAVEITIDEKNKELLLKKDVALNVRRKLDVLAKNYEKAVSQNESLRRDNDMKSEAYEHDICEVQKTMGLKYDELKSEYDILKNNAEIDKWMGEIDELKGLNATSNVFVQELEKNNSNLKNTILIKNAMIADQNDSLLSLRKKLDKSTKSNSDIRKEINLNNDKIIDLQCDIGEKEHIIHDLEHDLEKYKAECADAVKNVHEYENDIHDLQIIVNSKSEAVVFVEEEIEKTRSIWKQKDNKSKIMLEALQEQLHAACEEKRSMRDKFQKIINNQKLDMQKRTENLKATFVDQLMEAKQGIKNMCEHESAIITRLKDERNNLACRFSKMQELCATNFK